MKRAANTVKTLKIRLVPISKGILREVFCRKNASTEYAPVIVLAIEDFFPIRIDCKDLEHAKST